MREVVSAQKGETGFSLFSGSQNTPEESDGFSTPHQIGIKSHIPGQF